MPTVDHRARYVVVELLSHHAVSCFIKITLQQSLFTRETGETKCFRSENAHEQLPDRVTTRILLERIRDPLLDYGIRNDLFLKIKISIYLPLC